VSPSSLSPLLLFPEVIFVERVVFLLPHPLAQGAILVKQHSERKVIILVRHLQLWTCLLFILDSEFCLNELPLVAIQVGLTLCGSVRLGSCQFYSSAMLQIPKASHPTSVLFCLFEKTRSLTHVVAVQNSIAWDSGFGLQVLPCRNLNAKQSAVTTWPFLTCWRGRIVLQSGVSISLSPACDMLGGFVRVHFVEMELELLVFSSASCVVFWSAQPNRRV
jgi:hypothetical protein